MAAAEFIQKSKELHNAALTIRKAVREFFAVNEIAFVSMCRLLPDPYCGVSFRKQILDQFSTLKETVPQAWDVTKIDYVVLSLRNLRLSVDKKVNSGSFSAAELQAHELLHGVFDTKQFESLLMNMRSFCTKRDV